MNFGSSISPSVSNQQGVLNAITINKNAIIVVIIAHNPVFVLVAMFTPVAINQDLVDI